MVENHSSVLVTSHYDFLQHCIVSETMHFKDNMVNNGYNILIQV